MWLLRSGHKHIAQDTLSEYLDGRLRGRRLERAERQLQICDACRRELEELQATVAMMRQLPMEPPPRSFVMSAPPPEPARARPALALRAPNWVYAGAASVAALALAITVSVDATGGLSPDPLRRDVEITTLAPAPASEQITITSGPAAEPAIESASRPEEPPESGNDGTAPPSLAAAAPSPPATDQLIQVAPAGEGATALGAEKAPLATSAPEAAAAAAPQDAGATLTESTRAEAASTAVVPEETPAQRAGGADRGISPVENQTAKTLTIEAPAPLPEPAGPARFDEDGGNGTSVWWRVLEAAAGTLTVVFLAGLALRRRASRRDAA